MNNLTSSSNTTKELNILLCKRKIAMVFTVLWAHITLLDLFLVTRKGPRFLWQESLQLDTQLVHLALSALATLFFYYFSYIGHRVRQNNQSEMKPIATLKSNP